MAREIGTSVMFDQKFSYLEIETDYIDTIAKSLAEDNIFFMVIASVITSDKVNHVRIYVRPENECFIRYFV